MNLFSPVSARYCQFNFDECWAFTVLSSSPAEIWTMSVSKDFLISCRERGSAGIWKQALADFFFQTTTTSSSPVLHAHVPLTTCIITLMSWPHPWTLHKINNWTLNSPWWTKIAPPAATSSFALFSRATTTNGPLQNPTLRKHISQW